MAIGEHAPDGAEDDDGEDGDDDACPCIEGGHDLLFPLSIRLSRCGLVRSLTGFMFGRVGGAWPFAEFYSMRLPASLGCVANSDGSER
jgi:hypothetical protein